MSTTTDLVLSEEKPFEMGIYLQIDPRMPKRYDVYRLLKSKANSRGHFSNKIVYVIYDTATKEKVGDYDPERFAQKLRGPEKIVGFVSHSQFDRIDRDIEFNKKASAPERSYPTRMARHTNGFWNHYASMHGGKKKTRRSKKTVKRKHKKSKTHKRRAY